MARVTLSTSASPVHQPARPVGTHTSTVHQHAQARPAAAGTPWAHARTLGNGATRAPHTAATRAPGPLAAGTRAPHTPARVLAAQLLGVHQAGAVLSDQASGTHQPGTVTSAENLQIWQRADIRRAQLTSTHQPARPVAGSGSAAHTPAVPVRWAWRPVWQPAMPAPIGPGWVLIVPPPPPDRRTPTTHLLFTCPPLVQVPGSTLLLFRVCDAEAPPPPPPPPPPGEQLVIHPARFYMSVHSLELHMLPSLQALPITGATISSDARSTGWSFTATGPGLLFDALEPISALQPRHVRLTLDGLAFVFVVDSVSRPEGFGRAGATVRGRSPSALLADPYALHTTRANANPATAEQLAAAALSGTGIDLDWGIDDWSVPAGAWSHQGTPLQAVQAVAEAAGGFVLTSRDGAALQVRHPYPTLPGGIPGGPWNWSLSTVQADVELAADAVHTLDIERRDSAPINGVWVTGTNAGVARLVRRSGTQGETQGPMQINQLITADAAAQQRGLSVLGAAGAKYLVQVDLPVLTGGTLPGVLEVGQLVQVNSAAPWRGRVRSVAARANFGKEVRQTVALERHIDT